MNHWFEFIGIHIASWKCGVVLLLMGWLLNPLAYNETNISAILANNFRALTTGILPQLGSQAPVIYLIVHALLTRHLPMFPASEAQ